VKLGYYGGAIGVAGSLASRLLLGRFSPGLLLGFGYGAGMVNNDLFKVKSISNMFNKKNFDDAVNKGAELKDKAVEKIEGANRKDDYNPNWRDEVANKKDQIKDKVADKKDQIKDKVAEKKDQIKDKVAEKKDQIKDRFGDVVDKEKSKDVKDQAKEKITDLKEKASDVKDKAKDKVVDLKDQAKDKVSNLKDQTKEKVDQVKDKAGDLKEAAKDKISDLKSKVNDKVSEVKDKVADLKEKVDEKKESFDKGKTDKKVEKEVVDTMKTPDAKMPNATGSGAANMNKEKPVPHAVDKNVDKVNMAKSNPANFTPSDVEANATGNKNGNFKP